MKTKLFLISLTAISLLLSGCAQPEPENAKLRVSAGDKIAVEYKGSLQDGTVFDSSEGRSPLEFTAGAGQMIKGFDNAVIGMALHEEKTVTLKPEEAYGPENPNMVIEIPTIAFASLENLKPGMRVSGEGQGGIIKEVRQDSIVIDYNHPLAGKTLIFWIKVVKIEKA